MGSRFAFYGRISTADFQDAVSSSRWQQEVACETVAGRGVVVAEFFDGGCSRRVPWEERPAAAELLAAARSPESGFDAVVAGEYERAFYGGQFQSVSEILRGCGVEVWLPETSGPVVLGDATHQALMLSLGSQSQREVVRARHRVMGAMRAQRGGTWGSSAVQASTDRRWSSPEHGANRDQLPETWPHTARAHVGRRR